jgi:hypothetical protein
MANPTNDRRGFLRRLMAASGVAAAAAPAGQGQTGANRDQHFLPPYAWAQDYKSLKQSSYDISGAIAMPGAFRLAARAKCFEPAGRA